MAGGDGNGGNPRDQGDGQVGRHDRDHDAGREPTIAQVDGGCREIHAYTISGTATAASP